MTVGSRVKQTLSGLRGAESTLEIYAAQTRDRESKRVFEEAVKTINEISGDLEKRIGVLELEEPQYKGL